MATIPDRIDTCCKVIDNILPQVDRLYLSLNGFSEQPQWLDSIKNLQCEIHSTDILKANVVWEWSEFFNGYIFIIDDDIEYPPNYVETMIQAIERYNRQAVISVHGKWFDFQKRICLTHFSHRLQKDMKVQIAGIGTCAFHTDTIKPCPIDFPIPYFRDLQFALLCKKENIPIQSIVRKDGWLKPLSTHGTNLCDITHNDIRLRQTGIFLLKGLQ